MLLCVDLKPARTFVLCCDFSSGLYVAQFLSDWPCEPLTLLMEMEISISALTKKLFSSPGRIGHYLGLGIIMAPTLPSWVHTLDKKNSLPPTVLSSYLLLEPEMVCSAEKESEVPLWKADSDCF